MYSGREFWRGKENAVVFNLQYFIGIIHSVAAVYQTDLIIGSAVVGHSRFLLAIHIGNIEHVKVAEIMGALVVEEIIKFGANGTENVLVKVVGGCGGHGCKIQRLV